MWGTKGDLRDTWSTCLEVKPKLHERSNEFYTNVYSPNYKKCEHMHNIPSQHCVVRIL
jgi:hypothetical protein